MWIDDQILARCHEPQVLSTWVPSSTMVVLGSSNKSEVEVKEHACLEDGVPVLKRYGGGGTVVLHSGCVVISLGLWVSQFYDNNRYFRMINDAVIQTLAASWPVYANLRQDGLSDIAMENRKIAGTSLFRSRNYLLYQASLLVDAKVDLLERYLEHPSREPEYREGKSHRDFVAGLGDFVKNLSSCDLEVTLARDLMPVVQCALDQDLIAVQPKQCSHLYKRAGLKVYSSGIGHCTHGSDHVIDAGSH